MPGSMVRPEDTNMNERRLPIPIIDPQIFPRRYNNNNHKIEHLLYVRNHFKSLYM